jgi:outer membrane scaffolding protein for murein synthesis (MipA/OmpV family)
VNLSHARIARVFRAQAMPLLIVSVLAPTLGWAQQSLESQALEQQGLTRPQMGWAGTVGAGLALAAKYPGASAQRARLAPLIAIDYDDRISVGPLGIAVAALRWRGLRAGPVLGFQRGRRDSDDPRLAGLGDISSSVTGGFFAAYTRGPLEVSATARQALSHSSNGLSGLLQVNVRHAFVLARTFAAAGPDLEFGNGDFQRTWFGISPVQSSTSGLPVYVPRAGINRIGIHADLTHRATQHILLRFFARLSDLTGEASQSPIVERRVQFDVGAGIAYHF